MAIKIQGVEIISDSREITGLKFGSDSIAFPSSDGSNNQILKTDGVGNLTFVNVDDIVDHIVDVVEDTTPQLGGNLDVNGFAIVGPSANNVVTVDTDNLLLTGTLGSSDNVIQDAHLNKITFNTIAKIVGGTATSSSTVTFNLTSFDATKVRSMKIIIQATNSTSGYYYTTELLCMHDGTDAYNTEYATLDTSPNGDMIQIATALQNGQYVIKITPTTTDTISYKVFMQQVLI